MACSLWTGWCWCQQWAEHSIMSTWHRSESCCRTTVKLSCDSWRVPPKQCFVFVGRMAIGLQPTRPGVQFASLGDKYPVVSRLGWLYDDVEVVKRVDLINWLVLCVPCFLSSVGKTWKKRCNLGNFIHPPDWKSLNPCVWIGSLCDITREALTRPTFYDLAHFVARFDWFPDCWIDGLIKKVRIAFYTLLTSLWLHLDTSQGETAALPPKYDSDDGDERYEELDKLETMCRNLHGNAQKGLKGKIKSCWPRDWQFPARMRWRTHMSARIVRLCLSYVPFYKSIRSCRPQNDRWERRLQLVETLTQTT